MIILTHQDILNMHKGLHYPHDPEALCRCCNHELRFHWKLGPCQLAKCRCKIFLKSLEWIKKEQEMMEKAVKALKHSNL